MSIEVILEKLGLQGEVTKDEFWSPCPFHNDKKPSWSIKLRGQKRGLHKCFSCGSKGNLVSLVVHVRKCGDFEAAVWIAENDTPELPKPAPMRVVFTRPAEPLGVREPPPGVEFAPLESWPDVPRTYAESRGLVGWQVARWGIGYAIEGRLAGRIVIPTRNERGWVSYSARDFTGRAVRRYLYPPAGESDSSALFGEEHWPDPALRWTSKLVVLEGAIDALAVERHSSSCFIAALGGGSSLRLEHARRIATFGKIVVMTDPDDAGDKMAKRIFAAVGRHSNVQRLRLTPGQDAASTPPEELTRWLSATLLS